MSFTLEECQDLYNRLKHLQIPDLRIDVEIADCLGIAWSYGENGMFEGYKIMPDRIKFTSLLHAAVRLLPKDCDWIIGNVNGQIGGTPYCCVGDTEQHYGETVAISICMGALHFHMQGLTEDRTNNA
jgi:hypothetical protein